MRLYHVRCTNLILFRIWARLALSNKPPKAQNGTLKYPQTQNRFIPHNI